MKLNKLLFASTLLFFSAITFGQKLTNIAVTDAKSDLDTLIQTFERVHYNPYFIHSKSEILSAKNEAIDSWVTDSIPLKDFMQVGMKLSALMSGGHSYMYWKNEAIIPELKLHQYVPFTGRLSSDLKTFTVSRTTDTNFAVGSEIIAINGIPVADLYKECMAYIGGIDAFANATCEGTFPFKLFFNKDLQPPFGIQTSNSIVNTSGLDINALIGFLNSAHAKEDYTFSISENNVGVITYNSCNGFNTFNKFLNNTFKKIHKQGIDKLIIDIRENGGGDSGLNDLLLEYLTKSQYQQSSERYWKVSAEAKKAYIENKTYTQMFGEEFMTRYMNTPSGEIIKSSGEELTQPTTPKNYFEGKTCFLIGPNTFSSANFLADAVKTYKLSTLIGTATGEYTNDFGEQLNFNLLHSGCTVFISSTYDIGANGNKTELQPVNPDIIVEHDALEFALKWIEK